MTDVESLHTCKIYMYSASNNSSLTGMETTITALMHFLAHLSIAYAMAQRPSSVRPSTFHILNFFSRTAEGVYSKLATNVPYEVPEQVLLLFKSIRNLIWPPWPLIG